MIRPRGITLKTLALYSALSIGACAALVTSLSLYAIATGAVVLSFSGAHILAVALVHAMLRILPTAMIVMGAAGCLCAGVVITLYRSGDTEGGGRW